MSKWMDYIDDPEIRETMKRVSDNLDRVDRLREQRKNPDENKIRVKDIRSSMDEDMKAHVKEAACGIGLVLTGGGAKGSYQVGVCKTLAQNGYLGKTVKYSGENISVGSDRISGLAGTSAGALNAALLSGGSVEAAERLWTAVDEGRMNGKDGFFAPSEENDRYLEELIRESGVLPGIRPGGMITVATAFDYESGYPRDFLLNSMTVEEKVKCLMASAAFPLALKEQEIAGTRYIDGGIPVFGSNMPIAPLYHLGFRRFIVIHCSSREEASEFAGLGKLNLLMNKEQYYNGAAFVHIYPSRDLGGVFQGTANFNHDYIMSNISLGSKDMEAAAEDLTVLFERLDPLDELHLVGGSSYRSYRELLEAL